MVVEVMVVVAAAASFLVPGVEDDAEANLALAAGRFVFFDVLLIALSPTNAGAVLNRFLSDTQNIDSSVPDSLLSLATQVLNMSTQLILVLVL